MPKKGTTKKKASPSEKQPVSATESLPETVDVSRELSIEEKIGIFLDYLKGKGLFTMSFSNTIERIWGDPGVRRAPHHVERLKTLFVSMLNSEGAGFDTNEEFYAFMEENHKVLASRIRGSILSAAHEAMKPRETVVNGKDFVRYDDSTGLHRMIR